MEMYRKTVFFLIVIAAFLCFLPGTSLADPADILRFEPGDTLEEIRDKIEHNGYRFTVGHNWVFDMSAGEKEKFFSRRAPLFPGKAALSQDIGPLYRHLGKALSLSFDWRDYNGHSYIGNIRDQGDCGSCYAFAACAAAEGTYNWANGLYDANCADFSESYIIWCLGRLPEYSSNFFGCDGSSYNYYELEALTVQGVTTEADFLYTTSDPGSCTHWDDPTTTFQSWHRIGCNDIEAIKTAIMTYGVVDAAVYVGVAFQSYSYGIYEDSNTSCSSNPCYYTPTNHAIALVGWDDMPPEGGGGCWILRNSWGTDWGESGYMRIRYTAASVACEATYLSYQSPTGLKVTPSGGLSPEGNSGGPFSPDSITYTLENLNDTGINYTVSKGASWVSISNTGGYLAGHASTEVTVSINSNANPLSNGTYTDTVTFTNATDHDGDDTRSVTLTVGIPSLQYSWDMDTDPGWTTDGLWAWGQPTGGGGEYGGPDPTSGYTGSNVYGYNLSGDYENDLSETHLTSTAINCSGMSRVTVKFRRWLGVEDPDFDYAYVRVSNDGSAWTTVDENVTEIADTSWSLQAFNISAVADGQSTVYLRWTMGATDYDWQYCGWNIDDIEIWAVPATATSPTVTTTGVSSVTSNSASGGGNVTSAGGALVMARGVCWNTFANPTKANSKTTDGTGTGSFTSSITGLSPGTTYHVRAYATNSVGTSYGSDLTFTTSMTDISAVYFPHIASHTGSWETEICVINTSDTQTISGVFKAYSNAGTHTSVNIAVTLASHGRREITVGDEFSDPANISYIIFESDSNDVAGYTKFYIEGQYRAAVPAISEINTSDIYISHIASDSSWWTGISLLNTTSSPKTLTIEFKNGQTKTKALAANEHSAFTIKSLFNDQPQPGIQSAVIKAGSGVIGLELFGSGNQLSGILLKDDTTTKIYYAHIASNATWWTGVVAYNPSTSASTITITPYTDGGTSLTPQSLTIGAQRKYIGIVADLNLPNDTAWMQIEATNPITGFELFGTKNGNQLASYTGVGISGKNGVFAKLEKDGWTGIVFVNLGDSTASMLLTAYDDNGNVITSEPIGLAGHEKMVDMVPNLFSQDISNATYITYSSDLDVVGFQLNGSSDGMMLDGLPGQSSN